MIAGSPLKDRTVRSLVALEKSASTARVLNLAATHRKLGADPELAAKPFFRNRLLDHGIIVKHRVRANERDLFTQPLATTTKIMAPIDASDLRAGARSFMVGQRGFDEAMVEAFGDELRPGAYDRRLLDTLSELPSLDPFLLREHMKRNGFEAARPYFAITDADIQRMYDFVRAEVMALVTLSSGQGGGGQAASRLVEKLLSATPEAGFEPLKDGLQLSDKDYQDGVFCWRGFLYYKWILSELTTPLARVMAALLDLHARGPATAETQNYLPKARERINTAVAAAIEAVRRMMEVYDTAYRSLTLDGKPAQFRDFLLAAPDMFMMLGEQCGAVQHIVSFWQYRFPGRRAVISPEELMEIFLDFEDGLAFTLEIDA